MAKRKASLGLGAVIKEEHENIDSAPPARTESTASKLSNASANKKQSIPIYVDPLLHEALHVLVFSERRNKTTFQTLFLEALDLLLEKKGLPSVAELSSGEKTINL
jgi:hypothetical protein